MKAVPKHCNKGQLPKSKLGVLSSNPTLLFYYVNALYLIGQLIKIVKIFH